MKPVAGISANVNNFPAVLELGGNTLSSIRNEAQRLLTGQFDMMVEHYLLLVNRIQYDGHCEPRMRDHSMSRFRFRS